MNKCLLSTLKPKAFPFTISLKPDSTLLSIASKQQNESKCEWIHSYEIRKTYFPLNAKAQNCLFKDFSIIYVNGTSPTTPPGAAVCVTRKYFRRQPKGIHCIAMIERHSQSGEGAGVLSTAFGRRRLHSYALSRQPAYSELNSSVGFCFIIYAFVYLHTFPLLYCICICVPSCVCVLSRILSY